MMRPMSFLHSTKVECGSLSKNKTFNVKICSSPVSCSVRKSWLLNTVTVRL